MNQKNWNQIEKMFYFNFVFKVFKTTCVLTWPNLTQFVMYNYTVYVYYTVFKIKVKKFSYLSRFMV